MLQATYINSAFAANGDKTTPPESSDQGFVNFNFGYTTDYEINLNAGNPQAKAVERRVQNYLFNVTTQNAMVWQRQTFAPWMPNIAYGINVWVMRQDVNGMDTLYRSKTIGNVTDPQVSTTWEKQLFWGEMKLHIPMPAGGSGPNDDYTNEVILNPINTRTINHGTYEFVSDEVAAASQNMPSMPGQPIIRGMLEVKRWYVTGANYAVMRYTDVNGRLFTSAYDGVQWSPWAFQVEAYDIHGGQMTYAVAQGAGPAYTATTSPSTQNIRNGSLFYIYWTSSAQAGATLNVNGTGAFPIVNQLAAGISANDVWGLTALMFQNSSWRVLTTMGIPNGFTDALSPNQFPRLSQVQRLITEGKVNTVEWTNVLNKPDVAIQNLPAQFQTVRLSSPIPGLDFIFGGGDNKTTPFNFRILNGADKTLMFLAQGQTPGAPMMTLQYNPSSILGGTITNYTATVFGKNTYIPANQEHVFVRGNNTADPAASIVFDGATLLFKAYRPDLPANGVPFFNLNVTGLAGYFRTRPTWGLNGDGQVYTPWDSQNLKLTQFLQLNMNNETVAGTFMHSSTMPTINLSQITTALLNNGSVTPPFGISGDLSATGKNNPSLMRFVRSSAGSYYGTFVALDTDNIMKIGGDSFVAPDGSGATACPILHTGNMSIYIKAYLDTYMQQRVQSSNYYDIGQVGMFQAVTPDPAGIGTVGYPGYTFSGAYIRWSGMFFTWSQGAIPPGTWRLQSYTQGVFSASQGGYAVLIATRIA